MSQQQSLYHLQAIELKLRQHQRRLQEIATILANDAVVAAAQKKVDAAQNHLTPLRTKTRDLELEIQSAKEKAQTTEDNLYSGSVTNPKEMQDMQLEIASLKQRGLNLEDTLLETMVAVEEGEEGLADAENELQQVLDERKDEHHHLLDERSTLQAGVVELNQQRETVQAELTADNLKLYESMKPGKGNRPIAALQEDSCSICGVEQTTMIAREVQIGQSLVNCTNCGRILVSIG
jgi:hypothetical protein